LRQLEPGVLAYEAVSTAVAFLSGYGNEAAYQASGSERMA